MQMAGGSTVVVNSKSEIGGTIYKIEPYNGPVNLGLFSDIFFKLLKG